MSEHNDDELCECGKPEGFVRVQDPACATQHGLGQGGERLMPTDPRGSRAWRKLRAQVIAEEPLCWLQLPGCTRLSTTADHILTFKERPDLAMVRANLRGACAHCNYSRNDTPVTMLNQDNARALEWFK